ncbi:uroporphyrinogen-III synthase [Sulfurovum sp. XGS-02]|uniref:uroporphyrinogen-III synthase n=1 Tax=Sulfurovum sp. XGS-02 TaxID=2925411 RepID=UPI00204828E8|nr:uroporphyrinogen-III synthase [Sulfurovum sp. XGS-02]UPT77186.1 uroporphyrinogen-III synthase [Sulfurovum sp. XGS-02]
MKKIQNILEPLNLIYYTYDEKMNLLVLDNNWPSEYTYNELIKITHALSKKHIHFFIDENKSIVIADSDTLVKKIKRYFSSMITNIKNSRMPIYILSDKKVKWAKNLPVFAIEPIPQDVDLSSYDALVFTSKNAIYSLDSMDKTWKKKPAYVIAPETAKIVKHLGGKLAFVGKEKHGDKFALEIAEKYKHQKLLYIRASKVVSNLVNILNSNGIICDELIIYQTVCKPLDKKITLPKNSTIIFSSPSTIECFFKNISWDESFKAISIGKTTAQYFPQNITPVISDTSSLESCVKKAIELNS